MYDELADSYDRMTGFEKKWDPQKAIWKELIDKYSADTVLDFGCGTGFHSILLGSLGLKVIGIDPSSAMIKKANENLAKHAPDSDVRFIHGDMVELANIPEKFDWILCLGNTIPHFLDQRNLEELIILFYKKLEDFGSVWMQLLNYRKILKEKKRMVGVTGNEKETFFRFYDFTETNLIFNVLHVIRESGKFHNSWNQTELKPYTIEDLKKIMAELMLFDHVEFFSDVKGSPYRPAESNNLLLVSHKL